MSKPSGGRGDKKRSCGVLARAVPTLPEHQKGSGRPGDPVGPCRPWLTEGPASCVSAWPKSLPGPRATVIWLLTVGCEHPQCTHQGGCGGGGRSDRIAWLKRRPPTQSLHDSGFSSM